jgi:hypothetical protein
MKMSYQADYPDLPPVDYSTPMRTQCTKPPTVTSQSGGKHCHEKYNGDPRRQMCITCDEYAAPRSLYCRKCNDEHIARRIKRTQRNTVGVTTSVSDVSLGVAKMSVNAVESVVDTTKGVLGDVLDIPIHLLNRNVSREDEIMRQIRGMSAKDQARMIFAYALAHYGNANEAHELTNDMMNNPEHEYDRITLLRTSLLESSAKASGAKAESPVAEVKPSGEQAVNPPRASTRTAVAKPPNANAAAPAARKKKAGARAESTLPPTLPTTKQSGANAGDSCSCASCVVEAACVSAAAKASGAAAVTSGAPHSSTSMDDRRTDDWRTYTDRNRRSPKKVAPKDNVFDRYDKSKRGASGCHSSDTKRRGASGQSGSHVPSVAEQLHNSGFTYDCYKCRGKVFEAPECRCGAKVPGAYLNDFLISSGAYDGASSGAGFMDSLIESAEGLNYVFGF